MDENIMGLENGSSYLTKAEIIELEEKLTPHNIKIITFDNHHPKASLNDIMVFFSSHLTELFIAGLIMPAVYDVIKYALKTIIFKIRGKVKIIQSRKIRDAVPTLCLKIKNIEIYVPIPLSLTEKQFENYIDGVREVIENVKPKTINVYERSECFIVEQNAESSRIEIKTMLQYAHEKCENKKGNLS